MAFSYETLRRWSNETIWRATVGSLLIISSAFAGEPQVVNPSTDKQARRDFEKTTKERPWQDSLGMKFVPVPGAQVFFCIWDTRVGDFQAFVGDTGYDALPYLPEPVEPGRSAQE